MHSIHRVLVRLAALSCAILLAAALHSPRVAQADVVVSDHGSGGVFRFDNSGNPIGAPPLAVGTASSGQGVTYGPDGYLYVSYYDSANNEGEVLKFNPFTGAQSGGAFVAPGSGGLGLPGDIKFHNGLLYVTNYGGTTVNRYNASTGAYVDALDFGAGSQPSALAFRDNTMFVSCWGTHQVQAYDLNSNTNLGNFISGGAPLTPSGVAFGPDGYLYVTNMFSDSVEEYDGISGAYVTTYPTLPPSLVPPGTAFASGVAFMPDGTMLVTAIADGAVFARSPRDLSGEWSLFTNTYAVGLFQPALAAVSPMLGDANADGVVDLSDIQMIARNWNTAGPGGNVTGFTTGDSIVDLSDIQLLAQHWNQHYFDAAGGGGASVVVPEPGTGTLAGLAGVVCLVAAARRRVQQGRARSA